MGDINEKPGIIVIGFPKSGTSTLQTAFEKSGIRSVHWTSDEKIVGKLIYDGWFDEGDPFFHLTGIDAITQMDFCHYPSSGQPLLSLWPNLDISLLLSIRKLYPSCKFILNYRSPSKTADSISRWQDLQKRLIIADCIGLPEGRGNVEEVERWIGAHVAAVRHIFRDDENFLDLDITSENARAALEVFLGRKLSWWGIANKNTKRIANH